MSKSSNKMYINILVVITVLMGNMAYSQDNEYSTVETAIEMDIHDQITMKKDQFFNQFSLAVNEKSSRTSRLNPASYRSVKKSIMKLSFTGK